LLAEHTARGGPKHIACGGLLRRLLGLSEDALLLLGRLLLLLWLPKHRLLLLRRLLWLLCLAEIALPKCRWLSERRRLPKRCWLSKC